MPEKPSHNLPYLLVYRWSIACALSPNKLFLLAIPTSSLCERKIPFCFYWRINTGQIYRAKPYPLCIFPTASVVNLPHVAPAPIPMTQILRHSH